MATKKKPKKDHIKSGPKVLLDKPEIRSLVLAAAALDANIEAMCAYARISPDAYYDYIKIHPELSEEVVRLKKQPYLKAIKTIVANLDDPYFSLKYLERRAKKEFSTRTELTGAEGRDLKPVTVYPLGIGKKKTEK